MHLTCDYSTWDILFRCVLSATIVYYWMASARRAVTYLPVQSSVLVIPARYGVAGMADLRRCNSHGAPKRERQKIVISASLGGGKFELNRYVREFAQFLVKQ